MVQVKGLNVQHIVDGEGQRTGVILSIDEFEGLLEDMDDLATAVVRGDEPALSHDDLLSELRDTGLLTD